MPEIKHVPWAETRATDRGTHKPEKRSKTELTDEEVTQRLTDLRYT